MTSTNPLFPHEDTPQQPTPEVEFVAPEPEVHTPSKASRTDAGQEAAANMVRMKVAEAFASEPNADEEIKEIKDEEAHHKKLSKHQIFLEELQGSGLSIVEVQTKWHEYYASLSDEEKHEVWREFYAGQATHIAERPKPAEAETAPHKQPAKKAHVSTHTPRDIATPSARAKRLREVRSTREIKERIRHTVSAGGALKPKHHFQSLLVGLGAGGIALIILLFGFFNETIIAPFIQPSRSVSSTPIILGNDTLASDGKSKIIIPKINVEIPVDYDVPSMVEEDIQKGLEGGVVHYPSTVLPGEQGNSAFFGHSSNNIFNPGEYKFAFVLLSKLEAGDMFYLTKDNTTYAYRIFDKKIVNPTDTWVLGNVPNKTATAALITCDPPGTTRYRLVVWGEQITPDPAAARAPAAAPVSTEQTALPGPAESLWQRLTGWLF